MYTFTIKQSRNGTWYWNLRGENNRIFASGRGFDTRRNAETSIRTVQEHAYDAKVVVVSKK